MTKVFIDGNSGTTGLKITDRLKNRKDIELMLLDENLRKNTEARRECLNSADIAFLCLPDDAAREAVQMTTNPNTVIIDTSTAHRVADGWTYGFSELKGQKSKISTSKRIANPGCHASGFVSLIAPLTETGAIDETAKLSCFSITGYSGGGKKMIAQYEDENKQKFLGAPRMYSLGQTHKHLPEMQKICGLKNAPVFCPIVSDFYSGMEVVIPLFANDTKATAEEISDIYKNYYTGKLIKFAENTDEDGFLSAGAMSGFDDMQIAVFGNKERILLVSRFDNLGKGASGAAIQNMNIVIGTDETTGLKLYQED